MTTLVLSDLKIYDFLNAIFSNITLYSHNAVISVWFFFFSVFCYVLFALLALHFLFLFFFVWVSFVLFCFSLLLQELVKGFQWWPSLWKEVPMLSPSFWSTCETLLLFPLWYAMAVAGHLTSLPLVTNTLKKEGESFPSVCSFSIHMFNLMVG